jgi:CubicO group peptidase (beta-lactamase class C family)
LCPPAKWRLAYSTADPYGAAKATPLDFAPGTRWQYSDQGYFLLGLIIEKISSKSYRQFVTERIFKPAVTRCSRCPSALATRYFGTSLIGMPSVLATPSP